MNTKHTEFTKVFGQVEQLLDEWGQALVIDAPAQALYKVAKKKAEQSSRLRQEVVDLLHAEAGQEVAGQQLLDKMSRLKTYEDQLKSMEQAQSVLASLYAKVSGKPWSPYIPSVNTASPAMTVEQYRKELGL